MKITVPVEAKWTEVEVFVGIEDITNALREAAREPAGTWPRAANMLTQAIQVLRAVPDDIVASANPEPRKLVRQALEKELARWQEPAP